MKKVSFILITTLFSLLFLGSCDSLPWGCITGNDRIAIEQRVVGNFSNITSYGSFVVNVRTGTDYSLSIEADENLLPYIRTYIQGNNLVIETKNDRCIKSRESIVVDVVTRDVEGLKLAGSGVINANNINAEELDLTLSGSGMIECKRITIDYLRASLPGSGIIELDGTAETTDYSLSGSGLIKGIDLITSRCFANISGSGNIYTHVLEELDVQISGSGNLYYEGNPQIESKITGSGNLRRY